MPKTETDTSNKWKFLFTIKEIKRYNVQVACKMKIKMYN